MQQKWILLTLAVVLLFSFTPELVSDDSGFLTDYSQLKSIPGTGIRMYAAPDAYTDLRQYHAVMIDQPEFVIADDSRYKGFKPDDAKAVADAMRQHMIDAVSKNGRVTVSDTAGPGILYVRLAASNVHLKKKKRGVLGYTPVGFAVTTAVAAGQGVEKKIILQNMALEIEVMDSQSQEVFLSVVDNIAAGKKTSPSESWSQENTVMAYWATRLNCRLENSIKPQDDWQDCEVALP